MTRDEWTISLVYSPDGRWLAAGTGKRVTVWEVASGKVVRTLHGHDRSVTAVRFSPEGRRLASGGRDGRVVVWEFATGKNSLVVHRGPDERVADLAWSRDSNRLFSVHVLEPATPQFKPKLWGMEVRVWEPPTGKGQVLSGTKDFQGIVYTLFLSPDGTRLVTAHGDGTVKVWSVKDLLGK
jgi:WD40 repeat protein